MSKIIVRIIIIVVLILAVVGCYFIFLNPALNKNMELLENINEERQYNNSLNGLIDEYLLLRNDYNVTNAKYQKLLLEFPFDNDTTVIADEIYNIVDYSEVSLESINFTEVKTEGEDPEDQSTIGIIEIELLIKGSFYQILTFTNSFEVLPRTMKIKDITFESNPEDYEELSAYIKAETYYDMGI